MTLLTFPKLDLDPKVCYHVRVRVMYIGHLKVSYVDMSTIDMSTK